MSNAGRTNAGTRHGQSRGGRGRGGRAAAREVKPKFPVVPLAKRGPAPLGVPPPLPQKHSQKLQKVLAQSGLGSRRDMEDMIRSGKVLVNGVAATLGMRVNPEDLVKVGRRQIRFKLSARLPRVIIYHKPEGEIVSRDDPEKRKSVFERLPVIRSGKWLAIGRLDFNTCGLLIFTTSGELANRLSHPRFEVEREYAVRVMADLSKEQMEKLTQGVNLPDGKAHFELIEEQGGTGRNRWYRVVVKEGRNRLVRRMFEHFGIQVSRLMRTRFGIVNLPPRLKRGQHLELTEAQARRVLDWLATGGQRTGLEEADDGEVAIEHSEPPPSRRPSTAPPGRSSRNRTPPGRGKSRPGTTSSGGKRRPGSASGGGTSRPANTAGGGKPSRSSRTRQRG